MAAPFSYHSGTRYGPFGLDNEMLAAIRHGIESTSDHQGIQVSCKWDLMADRWGTAVCCDACRKRWTLYVGTENLVRSRSPRMVFAGEILPFYRRIAEEMCFSIEDSALLAEWLTERVAAAGDAGAPFAALVLEAGEELKNAPAEKVRQMIRQLELAPFQGDGEIRFRLPDGHPMRKAS